MRPLLIPALFALVWLPACSPCAWKRMNRAGLATAVAAIACDASQTSRAMDSREYIEMNPILGPRPSQATIGLYMASAAAATALAWWLLPERGRPAVWGPVIAVEAKAIAGNVAQDVPLCGL